MASDGEASAPVELGFVEPAPAVRLLSSQFPSKVGGRPAWLSRQLPEPERLRCGGCARPMIFLLQVYAPRGRAFHRTLLVFCCAHSPCPRRRFAVFRSQLGRINEFYSPEPQPEPEAEPPPGPGPGPGRAGAGAGLRLCRVCGASGPKSCSRCRWAHYCGKEHQSLDWKAGHREACGQALGKAGSLSSLNILFPEFELVMELEDSEDQERENVTCGEPLVAAGHDCVTEGLDHEELEAMAKHESKEDRIFAKFKRRIALAPDQVLRYCRGGSPLWVSEENVPSDVDIPSCACGAKREFEFQVMPQLLNHLKMDSFGESLDWGTLVVYTCEQNCDHGNEYSAEFIWKQDFSADHL
ncbi:LOW QUALITY PROTEIN: programmed cell death protein 2 [Hemiscyllium ocellatum]|uniref:LOW QUALITY PROTEIN: programmed cell death protein 2 n=1 Tax=Hemiscyllium ocellatum TaxID=170820 RepID=UPI00296653EE|nr:LOW QUALITY PROTEIN: programmed cell death protein 2 [Hemiscyllium ocellatum]